MLTWPVYAQCTSNPAFCKTCHEAQGLRPALRGAQLWRMDQGVGTLRA